MKLKYQYLIKTREKNCLENRKDQKAFIEYSNKNIKTFLKILNSTTQGKNDLLIVFDDMIADAISRNNLNQIVT